jgi:hypothetical protein
MRAIRKIETDALAALAANDAEAMLAVALELETMGKPADGVLWHAAFIENHPEGIASAS